MSYDDDYEAEVMGGSAVEFQTAIVGRKIVKVERIVRDYSGTAFSQGVQFTLDDGRVVELHDTNDCCAFTEVKDFEILADLDNVITSVTTVDGYQKWYVYAAGIPVVGVYVDWSPGNPYYYGFGFSITVKDAS